MKLYGGFKQTIEQSWKPAKRPRHNGQALIQAVTAAVRDTGLLERGLHTLIEGKEITPSFQGEIREIFDAIITNGRVDPNKHPEPFSVLNKYHQLVYGVPITVIYQLG